MTRKSVDRKDKDDMGKKSKKAPGKNDTYRAEKKSRGASGKKDIDDGKKRIEYDSGREQESKTGKSDHRYNIYIYASLLLIFLFSLFIRAVLPMGSVFLGDVVHYGGNDPWYHMMLAKSTVINLQRTWFDPNTYFPHGTGIHFGPLMSWGITIASYIVSLGSRPSPHTVEVVGAFFPALLGALVVFPVYFIGREICGRAGGLISAAIIAVIPGQFFSRSVLGFSDHHIAETLFSTLTILFFLLALRRASGISQRSLIERDTSALKMPLLYSALAGLSLGLYLDAWASGILFEAILLIFIMIQCTIDHLRGKNVEYLGIVGVVTFFVALLLILPFADGYNGWSLAHYSLFQPIMLILGILFIVFLTFVSTSLMKKGAAGYYFPGFIIGFLVLGLVIIGAFAPQIMASLTSGLSIFIPKTGGPATVAEASSILKIGGQYSLNGVQSNFPGLFAFISPFFLVLIALGHLLMRNIRIPRSTDLLVIIWSLLLLLLTLAQNRFAYYYAVNVAVLSGYLSVLIMNKTGFGELEEAILDKAPSNALRSTLQIWHPFVALALILLFIVPGLTFTLHAESYVGGPPDDWYSSVKWLENNTPSPGLDINIIYERPPKGADFTYPETAYGVMSWWDYGHWIETIGHRIPNANPFQQGIGDRSDGTPGSSPFFLAESEDEAEGVLARLDENRSLYMNSRYIITDVEMARSKFYAMASWSNEPITKYYGIFYQQQGEQFAPVQIFREPYFRTIVMRLHFFDGSETPVGDAFAVAYRTVEQEGLQFSVIVDQPKISRNYSELLEFVDEKRYEGYKAETVSESFLSPAVPLEALKHYRLVHESATAVTLDGQKYVKIFEHVPGATITGKAKAGTVATIYLPVKTNEGRVFVYQQSNVSNGEFTLVLPYSTEGPAEWSTNFDTAPVSPYQLVVGDRSYQLRVPEEFVIGGGRLEI